MAKKNKMLQKISFLLIVILLSTNNFISAQGFNSLSNIKILFVNETDFVYEDLTEHNGISRYFYHDSVNNETLVISQSDESEAQGYYKDGDDVYEVSNLYNIDLNNISTNLEFKNIFKTFIKEYYIFENMNTVDLSQMIESVSEDSTQPYGLSNARAEFYKEVGRPISERLVASATIDGKRAEVYEIKDVDIYQVDRVSMRNGAKFDLFLALLDMPYHVAVAFAVITFIKDGIEYLKYDYTFIKYQGWVERYKDITVEHRSTYEVGSSYSYQIWESVTDDSVIVELKWGYEDIDFSDNMRLMETAVENYR